MREVVTYTRRGSRFTAKQAAAWEAHHERWVIPDEAVDRPGFSLARQFGRAAPLVVEIGPGVGEATAALAAARPAYDVLAFEVWRPGVAETLSRLAAAGADNVRLCGVDAVWSLRHLLGPGQPGGAVDLLPRPVAQEAAPQAAAGHAGVRRAGRGRRLAPGGTWRLATDWADYAEQMLEVLDAEPGLSGGVVERWAERPVTRFERKGLEAGRTITDLAFTRPR